MFKPLTRENFPFGALPWPGGGGVNFRLWRPDLQDKEPPVLLLPDKGLEIPMEHKGGGWWEVDTSEAGAGSRYMFRAANPVWGITADVPDPASRCQSDGHTGPSVVTAPDNYTWKTENWPAANQARLNLTEIHIGTFTPEGTYRAAIEKLDLLKEAGCTGLLIDPVAERPGGRDSRSWGYDGTLWYAPANAYGAPEDLKALVDAAASRGMVCILDVVYNHFGPDGNMAHGTPLVDSKHGTPWGNAIPYDTPAVRDFAVANALMWLNEFRMGGLRLDAVHAILPTTARNESGEEVPLHAPDLQPAFLKEFSERVLSGVDPQRNVLLVAENERNRRSWASANPGAEPEGRYHAAVADDLHHGLHAAVTGEKHGYYAPYAADPVGVVAEALTRGMAFSLDTPRNHTVTEADRAMGLDPSTIINFLQNHDQIGNRAMGERLRTLLEDNPHGARIMSALRTLLYASPSIPCDFQGEAFGATTPFQFFCSFTDTACRMGVVKGRREEFRDFPAFSNPAARENIPDPLDPATFMRSKLQWPEDLESNPVWRETKRLAALREKEIVPLLESGLIYAECARNGNAIVARYAFRNGQELRLTANLGSAPATAPALEEAPLSASFAYASGETLEPWSVLVEKHPVSPALAARAGMGAPARTRQTALDFKG